jgi:hypothetical protein
MSQGGLVMLNDSPHSPEGNYQVRFLGGPFDGMQAAVPRLENGLAMPVSENALRMACGAPHGQPSLPSSVAFYKLVRLNTRWAYRYIGSTSAREVDLQKWLV